jgi:hypothetical protein
MTAVPKVVTAELLPFTFTEPQRLYVDLVSYFLKSNDKLLEFNIDGCSSSVFFNELSLEDHRVLIGVNNSVKYQGESACIANKKETKSTFSFQDFDEQNFTALILGYAADKNTMEKVKSICNESEQLRLVIIESDIDTPQEFILGVYSSLKNKGFHPHVSGKFTVMIKGDPPKTVRNISKTTKPLHAILAVVIIVFFVLFVMGFRRMIWS